MSAATPETVLNALRSTKLIENPKALAQFVSISLLAATTNKKAVESALMKPKFAEANVYIRQGFMLNNSLNNTMLTVAGLCFLLLKDAGKISYVVAFRRKFGIEHPWDGRTLSDNVSSKQKEIFADKVKGISQDEAKAFNNSVLKEAGYSKGSSTTGSTSG
jgi:hypothetical protein